MNPEIKKTQFQQFLSHLKKMASNPHSPLMAGEHCCFSELVNLQGIKFSEILGSEAELWENPNPDTLIIYGAINPFQMSLIKKAWTELNEPKFVIAFGNCSLGEGPFHNYSQVKVMDEIKIDAFIPGCPPTPETIVEALENLTRSRHV